MSSVLSECEYYAFTTTYAHRGSKSGRHTLVTRDLTLFASCVPQLMHKGHLELSLGPLLTRAREYLNGEALHLELIFENGPYMQRVDEAWASGRMDDLTFALLGGSGSLIYSWAIDDDTARHGGREYPDLLAAVEVVNDLLRKHAPIHGLLGMGQGGNVAQVVAAQAARSANGEGVARDLQFSIHLCGCKPGWQHQMPFLFDELVPLPAFFAAGKDDYADGDRADQGFGMSKLVHPKVAIRYVHVEGRRAFPSEPHDKNQMADSMVGFIMRVMTNGFPKPPLPPPPPPPPEVKMPPPMAETAIGLKAASSPACLAGPLTAPPVMTSGFSCASVASLSSTSAAPPAPTLKAAVSMPAAAPAEPASHLVEGGYEARTLLGGFEEGARRNAKADMLLGQLTKKTAPAQPAPQSSSWGGEVTRKDRRGKGSDGRVECPHCKRLFALALAPRHCQLCPDRYVAARLPAPPPQPVQRQLPASHSTGGPGLTTSIRSAAIPSMASKAGALDHTPPRARLGLRPSASWASASGGPRSVGTTGLTTSASMASTTSASPSSIISSRLLRPEEAPLMRQTSLPGRPDGHAWRSFIARIS